MIIFILQFLWNIRKLDLFKVVGFSENLFILNR